MMIIENPIAGSTYRVNKMPALEQFHVTRRLGPLLAHMGLTASALKDLGKGKMTTEDMMAFILPAIGGLSSMQDADVDYIINKCMTAVERQQDGGRWAKIYVANKFMFEDIDMLTMLQLTVEVIKYNLTAFSSGLSGLITSPSS